MSKTFLARRGPWQWSKPSVKSQFAWQPVLNRENSTVINRIRKWRSSGTPFGSGNFIFVTYVLFVTVAAMMHEPWRDEAQKWLIARDVNSVAEFFQLMPLEGAPGLWPALLIPFAKFGFPYGTVTLLNWAFVCAFAALVWFKSELLLVVRMAFLGSYFVAYDLPVIARNYGLGTLLLFVAVAFYGERTKRPLLFASIVALLMNANVFGIAQGAVLGVVLLWDLYRQCRSIRPLFLPALIMSLSFGIAGCQLLRFGAEGSVSEVIHRADRETLAHTLHVHYPWTQRLGELGLEVGFFVALAGIAAFSALLLPSWRALGLFIASLALSSKLVASNYTAPQYFGIVLTAAVASLWILAQDRNRAHSPIHLSEIGRTAAAFGTAGLWTLVVALGFSSIFAVVDFAQEIARPYSGALKVAEFLRRHGLERLPIAVFRDAWGSSIAPYLPDRQFYYPGADRFGTFIIQDKVHQANDFLSYDVATTRVFLKFKHEPRFLFITDKRLSVEAYPQNFRFLYESSRPSVISDEEFFVYECFPALSIATE